MDPATPDWRAFGQPAETEKEAAQGRNTRIAPAERLRRLPRSTLVAIAASVALTLGGLALAVLTPAGGGVALESADTGAAGVAVADGDGWSAGSAVELAGAGAAGAGELVVDVAGAVAQPGLVRLPPGSRVGDAIVAAGGYAVTADLAAAGTALNLAAPVGDGDKVQVPVLAAAGGDTRDGAPDGGGSPSDGGLVDLNRADQAALEALPGIGPVTAQRILEARGEAPFRSVDELRSRGLVGAATFTKLRDLVTTGS